MAACLSRAFTSFSRASFIIFRHRSPLVSRAGFTDGKRRYTNKNILKLGERGMLCEVFPDACPHLQDLMTKPQCIYSGFDPTADSLHLGHLLVLMVLLHGQRGGHEVIALIGGGTALVGDPSGKNAERPKLDVHTVEQNSEGIKGCLHTVFQNHEKNFWIDHNHTSPLIPLKVINNMSWYARHSVVDFLSSTGRLFRMGTMLLMSSVQSRLNSAQGMSFAEFSYQILQAYDWLHLLDKFNCVIQVGGSDQMGNIYAGYELISRSKNKPCYGITVPLIKSETGDKYGKSSGNAIWLDPRKTSPFEFYQFFLRLPDSEVETYLKLYTFLSLSEIKDIMEKQKKSPESRPAQKKLANLVTLLVHGDSGLKSAQQTTNVLFHGTPEMLAMLSEPELHDVFSQATIVSLILHPGITILQMAMEAKCFMTEDDAVRIINAGGFYVNFRKATNPQYVLIPGEHILPNNCTLIRVGKKHHYIVKWLR